MTLPVLPYPVSFSFLRDEENCPYKAYRRYVVRDLPKPNSTELKWGNAVHKAFELRINEGKPFVDNMQLYEPMTAMLDRRKAEGADVRAERMLGLDANERPIDFFDKSVAIRAKVDVPIIYGSTHGAYILDWKTGSPREDPFELQIQAWLLRCWFPGLEHIDGSYVWLKDLRMGARHELSDTERTAASVRTQMAEIVRRDDHWPKRPNPLCGYCEVYDCEHNKVRQPNERRGTDFSAAERR